MVAREACLLRGYPLRVITFVVQGEPVPQPRPRVSTRGGFARAYVPAKHPVHAYRKQIAAEATKAGLEPQSEPVEVIVEAVFVRPKSHMTKKGVKPTAPKLPRPDVDNIAKAILDSLHDVMGDDTNVRLLTVGKAYGNESRTIVSVKCGKP